MTEKIDAGVAAINSAGNSFNEIAEKVDQNAQLVNQISSAMEKQNAGAEEPPDLYSTRCKCRKKC